MNNMKKIFTATLFSLSLSALFGQEIKHYDLIVDFNIIQKKLMLKEPLKLIIKTRTA